MENNAAWSSNNVRLPAGFRFKPTDYELLVNYLFNKVHGSYLLPSPTPIIDCDVYGEGRAWKQYFEESVEDTLYFFTRLKHVNGKRVDRVTEWGTWKGQGDKEIYGYNGDQKVKIGSKRSFSFMPKNGVQEMRGKWVMHEFRLDGCLVDEQNNDNNSWSYVVCRIIDKMSKRRRNARDNRWS